MSPWSHWVSLFAVAFAAVVMVASPVFAVSGHGAPAAPHAIAGSTVSSPVVGGAVPGGAALLSATEAAIASFHIPKSAVLLPNLHAAPSTSNGIVHPGYVTSPAPMGLGDFGVVAKAGHDVGTITYSNSIEAGVTIHSVDPFYLQSTSPDWFTLQLNTVATHVDVLGNTSGTFWIQNVPIYQASTQTLGFEDNIWNFTAPGAGMQQNTLYSYSGNLVAPTFYYALGPNFHMPTPFTVDLYNNATVFNHRPTIWFNYTVIAGNGTVYAGSFDRVEFNSTAVANPTHNAPRPTFQINGQSLNAFGLLNDAEIMIGGPGGGSTTTLNGIDANMALWTMSNTTGHYATVPAGEDFGTDTGETSEGIAEWTNGGAHPVAVLGSGPSLLAPLWGLTGARSGHIVDTFRVTPANAFAFVSAGPKFLPSTAAWAPVPVGGVATYNLPPGTYRYQFLLSDHQSKFLTVTGSVSSTITLAYSSSVGVTTPLWAMDDAQLAAISQPGGAGTASNPYVLDNNGGVVNPLFGEYNDYYFPVFPGIFLADTTAYVSAQGITDFPITYSITPEMAFAAHFGTPYTNNLALQFYNTSHVSVADNPILTGWSFSQDSYMTSVLFWDCSQSLIAGNSFQVQSLGMILYGGSANVVWGNTFTAATTTAANPGTIYGAGSQFSMWMMSDGTFIFNNAFETPYTAQTPGFDLYSGAPTTWSGRWNATPQPATIVHHVNGFNLTGSILGLASVSGNFWADYGMPGNPYHVLPYNEYGAIGVGGDARPILPYAIYPVHFLSTHLTPGTLNWSVTVDGYTQTTSGLSLTFWEPNGTYAYTVGWPTNSTLTPHPHLGAFAVKSPQSTVRIRWA
jgi:thermopsin